MRTQTKLIALGAFFMILLSGIIVVAVFDDVEGPFIYQIDVLPVDPAAGDVISVIIYCIDPSGVSAAQLSSSIDEADWTVHDMQFFTCLCIAGGRWVATFGPIKEGETAEFFVTAFDDSPTRNPASTQIFEIEV